jgi:hypothetical protein
MIKKIQAFFKRMEARRRKNDRERLGWTEEEQAMISETLSEYTYRRVVDDNVVYFSVFAMATSFTILMVWLAISQGYSDAVIEFMVIAMFWSAFTLVIYEIIRMTLETIIKRMNRQKTLTLVDEWAVHLKEKESEQ